MKRHGIFIGLVVLMSGLGIWVLLRPSETVSRKSSGQTKPGVSESRPGSNAPAAAANPPIYRNDFAKLPQAEADAILAEIVQMDPSAILDRLLAAKREERDLSKFAAIASKFGYILRNQGIAPGLAARLKALIEDPTGDQMERQFLLGSLGSTMTRESIEFLLAVLPNLADPNVRGVALNSIAGSGSMWGDGNFHEERAAPLIRAWRESEDPELLRMLAMAMAAIGDRESVALLLAASAGPETASKRKIMAIAALDGVYTANAVPAVADFLKKQTTLNESSRRGANIMVSIGDVAASATLLQWLKTVDDNFASVIPELVRNTRTEEMREAWGLAVETGDAFRSRKVHEAIVSGVKKDAQSRRLEPLVK